MRNGVKRIAFSAVSLALAIAISYFESYIPMFVPGAKPGLSNIIILLVLYIATWKEALFVVLGKVFIVSLLRGNMFDVIFFMSLTGSFLSYIVMVLSKVFLKKLTPVGVSLLGAYFHTLGQVMALSIYMASIEMCFYFPLLSLFALATGVLTGLVAQRIVEMNIFSLNS